MASKYDQYWASELGQIRSGIERAAASGYAEVPLHGLRDEGDRLSWHGTVEVIGRQVVRSSMAHATSLGNTVALDRSCEQWAERTIRFVINAAGDTLTITASGRSVGDGQSQPIPPRSAPHPPTGPKPAPVQPQTGRPAGGSRQADTDEFYAILDELSAKLGGSRLLQDCTGYSGWPSHGVYFFFEDGEVRTDGSPRVVRVGTHALTEITESTLWGRLRQHRGHISGSHAGGGNHRASVFRRHVGGAIIRSGEGSGELLRSWLDRHHHPGPEMAAQEAVVEREVSRFIGVMPFLWLSVPERADRVSVERNSIALLSCRADGLDAPSAGWLGSHAERAEVRESGLWNVQHVDDQYDPGFLSRFAELMRRTEPCTRQEPYL